MALSRMCGAVCLTILGLRASDPPGWKPRWVSRSADSMIRPVDGGSFSSRFPSCSLSTTSIFEPADLHDFQAAARIRRASLSEPTIVRVSKDGLAAAPANVQRREHWRGSCSVSSTFRTSGDSVAHRSLRQGWHSPLRATAAAIAPKDLEPLLSNRTPNCDCRTRD